MIVHLDYKNMALYSYSFLDSNQATKFTSTPPTRNPIHFRPELPHKKRFWRRVSDSNSKYLVEQYK